MAGMSPSSSAIPLCNHGQVHSLPP